MKETKLVSKLIDLGFKISCAESCTGGLLAATIVNVPNASKVLNSSFVTYSNEEKMRLCEVNEETLLKFGAVSENVAGEMAMGCAKSSRAEVGVGISGIAGPSGGTKEKPVGTVCFGFFVSGKISTFTCKFKGRRNCVRKKSVSFAIDTLLKILEKLN